MAACRRDLKYRAPSESIASGYETKKQRSAGAAPEGRQSGVRATIRLSTTPLASKAGAHSTVLSPKSTKTRKTWSARTPGCQRKLDAAKDHSAETLDSIHFDIDILRNSFEK